jgi:hypothetical protein
MGIQSGRSNQRQGHQRFQAVTRNLFRRGLLEKSQGRGLSLTPSDSLREHVHQNPKPHPCSRVKIMVLRAKQLQRWPQIASAPRSVDRKAAQLCSVTGRVAEENEQVDGPCLAFSKEKEGKQKGWPKESARRNGLLEPAAKPKEAKPVKNGRPRTGNHVGWVPLTQAAPRSATNTFNAPRESANRVAGKPSGVAAASWDARGAACSGPWRRDGNTHCPRRVCRIIRGACAGCAGLQTKGR